MRKIMQYRYERYDDGELIDSYTCDPFNSDEIVNMIRMGLGELTTHIYEEYEDGTRYEIMLVDEKLYNQAKCDKEGVTYIQSNIK